MMFPKVVIFLSQFNITVIWFIFVCVLYAIFIQRRRMSSTIITHNLAEKLSKVRLHLVGKLCRMLMKTTCREECEYWRIKQSFRHVTFSNVCMFRGSHLDFCTINQNKTSCSLSVLFAICYYSTIVFFFIIIFITQFVGMNFCLVKRLHPLLICFANINVSP